MIEIPKIRPTRLKGKKLHDLYESVIQRDNVTCQKCEERDPLKLDPPHHIIYKSRGGSDTHANLILLCRDCHKWVHDNNIEILIDDSGWVFIKPESKIIA